ncbi:MAG: TIM-barrel domain-containing protein [Rhodanobacter sp.]
MALASCLICAAPAAWAGSAHRASGKGPLAAASASAPGQAGIRNLDHGIVIAIRHGAAQRIRLQVVSPQIIHVTVVPGKRLDQPKSLMAINTGGDSHFTVFRHHGHVRLSTGKVIVDIAIEGGRVQFLKPDGKLWLAARKNGSTFTPTTVEGRPFYAIRQQFESPADEGFYGLGQHQQSVMNYRGHDVIVNQHNMNIAIPLVVSTRNYGVLWDNNSITRFGDPRPYQPIAQNQDGLQLFDAQGNPGALTATYFVDGKQVLQRNEPGINYAQYHDSYANLPGWPAQLGGLTSAAYFNGQKVTEEAAAKAPDQAGQTSATKPAVKLGGDRDVRVVWTGQIDATQPGAHKFRLYASGYSKVFIDGKPVLDNWRQDSNPWYRSFRMPMTAGVKHTIRVEWTPQNGYIALEHLDPLPPREQDELSLYSELAHAIDYYFIGGNDMHEVIAGYRKITGKSVMLPRWAYGFWQSRCCGYQNSKELLDVVQRYRQLGLPLDSIVQDFQYWKPDAWGSHEFDRSRYPHPQQMVDSVHALHARLMLSMWPLFYSGTKNYDELKAHGDLYMRNIEAGQKDWLGHLYTYYDPYSKQARDLYWNQIQRALGHLGVDAWWTDSDEPDIVPNHSMAERKQRMGPTAMGPGAAFFNSYPLLHTQAMYEGSRRDHPNRRVFILSRSAFAGQQRNAAASWSGDTVARWSNLRDQISAAVNFSMSGIPNWSMDIGGFMVEKRYQDHPTPAAQDEWKELQLRWFQFGAFTPIFRSHGVHPYREIYNISPPGTPVYEALAWYDKLRYRLMPYIYTLAADTYIDDGSILRALAMDFPKDLKVRDINDEYLFGRAFLVAPVIHYKARSRSVYLPAGAAWYDFYSGKRYEGGQSINAAAPLARMPLFVRAGSIVPTGPAIQYTDEKPNAPITLFVYTGADGRFTLYNDQGTTYDYEHGAYTQIPIRYDDASGVLTIGAMKGRYPGMPEQREFSIRWIGSGARAPTDFDAPADVSVRYAGKPLSVRRPRA